MKWTRLPQGSAIESHVIEEVTELLHEAHAPLLAAGLNFMAATQDAAATLKRLSFGTSFLGSIDDTIVATGVIYEKVGRYDGTPKWFLRDDVAVFAQLAVATKYRKLGLGVKLLELFEQEARAWQKRYLACDTAEQARDLVSYYKRRGFERVADTQYPGATYRSIILSKDLL